MNDVLDFTKNYYRWALKDNDCIERYVDYRDSFPNSAVEEILESDTPIQTFDEIVFDWDCRSDDWLYETEFFNELEQFCETKGIDFEQARDCIYENFYWVYPESFLNPDVDVVITVDAGDMNYDFSCHNILNYCSSDKKELDNPSGLRWLAKQQGRLTLLNKEIKKSDKYHNGDCEMSKFVESCITELVNNCCHCSSLVFLTKMSLQKIIRLKEYKKQIEGKYYRYEPQLTKGFPFGYVTLSKDTICGLFDWYSGGGSLLEIELEKDVKIPMHYLWDIDTKDYLDRCYGLCSGCWKDTVKEIKECAK